MIYLKIVFFINLYYRVDCNKAVFTAIVCERVLNESPKT